MQTSVIMTLNTVPWTWQSMGTATQPAYQQHHAARWPDPTKPQLITKYSFLHGDILAEAVDKTFEYNLTQL